MECVLTGYYKLIRVWNVIDKQYNVILAVYWIQAVNYQGWAYQTEGEGSQAEIHPSACGKNSDAITLLQEGSLLITSAVLPPNYIIMVD